MAHTVRLATHADVEQMLDVHVAVADEARWIGTEAPVDRDRFARMFRDAIDADDAGMLVAVTGTSVVGNFSLYPANPGVIDVGMAIVDGHRGVGVGSRLLAAGLDWCRADGRGLHKVELEVWPHNAAALALYRKYGFAVEGRRRRQYRRRTGELWDSIVMGLVLDRSAPGSPHADA